MNIKLLLLLCYCICIILFVQGCQKDDEITPQPIETGTWLFNRAYDKFSITHIHFENNKMTLEYDTDQNRIRDYKIEHKYYTKKVGRNNYFMMKTKWDNHYTEWCEYKIHGDFMYLYFPKGEVVFVIQ